MASLMELVERVNRGELIDPHLLEIYQESTNSAEKFLAHHCRAMLDLRRAQQHMLQSLEAIDYSDQKVLNQFISISGFLGLSDLRTSPIVKFGASAIARKEFALGLEAIQNAISVDQQQNGSYSADRENSLFLASQFDRVAQSIGFSAPADINWNNRQTKIGWVVSGIADDEAAARTLAGLARHCDSERFAISVYSTESGVRREKQQFYQAAYVAGSAKRGAATIETLNERGVSTWIAPCEGDILQCTTALADQIVRDKIDVLILDVSHADPIACVAASWNLARVKVNLCRRTPIFSPGLDSVVYFDPARWETDKDFFSRHGIESRFIMEGMDVDQVLGQPPQRSVYGIPESALVLATSGNDLDRTISTEFTDTIINILRAHPQAIYLLIGEGELAWQKRKFESAGVAKRVGYAGRRKDLPGFLRICDLYLAEFPICGTAGVLGAMSVERPVVAARWGEEAHAAQAAALVGSEGAISVRDANVYIERVSRLIREQTYRAKLGNAMRLRIEQHFSFMQTARHFEQLCDQLIQNRTTGPITASHPERLEKVA